MNYTTRLCIQLSVAAALTACLCGISSAQIYYGDQIYLAANEGQYWLTGNQTSPETFNRSQQPSRPVVTNKNSQGVPGYEWTIRSSMAYMEKNKVPIKFGDEVYLADRWGWLNGARGPSYELESAGSLFAYCTCPITDNEEQYLQTNYKWRILPSPDNSLSAKPHPKLGQLVQAGDEIYLGCRYSNNDFELPFEGYILLSGGRGSGDKVRTNLFRSEYEKANAAGTYKWRITKAPVTPSRTAVQKNSGWLYSNHVERPDSNIAIGDFNGDGKTDVFTEIEGYWKVSDGGKKDWKITANAWQGVELLGFGDMNGDGRTDMLSHNNNDKGAWWQVHYSPPQGGWKYLHDSRVRPERITYGDFNGDGLTDGFYADKNGKWYVAHSPKGRLVEINSAVGSGPLRVADFDGDGRSDVFAIIDGVWKISFGGVTSWITVGRGRYPIHSLRFGDFNGDGRADVFHADNEKWNVHYFPFTGDWKTINSDSKNAPSRFWFGDFNGDAVTDVMAHSEENWIVSYGGNKPWTVLGSPKLVLRFDNVLDKQLTINVVNADRSRRDENFSTIEPKGSFQKETHAFGITFEFVTTENVEINGQFEKKNKVVQRLTIGSPALYQQFPVGKQSDQFLAWTKADQPHDSFKPRDSDFIDGKVAINIHQMTPIGFSEARQGYNISRMNPLDLAGGPGTLDENGQERTQALPLFEKINIDAPGSVYRVGGDGNLAGSKDMVVRFLPGGEQQETTREYFSASELTKSFGVTVSGSIGAGKPDKNNGEGRASVKYDQVRSKMDETRQSCKISGSYGWTAWSTLNKERVKLDRYFADYVRKMNLDSFADWTELFDKYGTHYPMSTLFGWHDVTETYSDSHTVGESLTTNITVSAGGKGSYKGVKGSGEGEVRTGKKESNKTGSVNGWSKSWSRGRQGGLVPIKVDLRPIYDICWVELSDLDRTPQAFEHFEQLRKRGPAMLARYRADEIKPASRNLRPRLFQLTLQYARLHRADDTDDGKAHVEVFGDVKLKASMSSDIGKSKEKTTGSLLKPVKCKVNDHLYSDSDSMLFVVNPTVTKTGAMDNFDKVTVSCVVNYKDKDPTGLNKDDPFDKDNHKSIKLSEMLKSPGKKMSFWPYGDRAGMLEIGLKIEEVSFDASRGFELPPFPSLSPRIH